MQPVQGRCAIVRLESGDDGAEHHVQDPSAEAHYEDGHQDHGITGRDAQERESNTDQQSSEDTEQLASPSIGQGPGKENSPDEPGKGEGADATKLLASEPGPPAEINPEGGQEYRHEIYRDCEAHHCRIAKNEGVYGIACAIRHVFTERLTRSVAKQGPRS